MRKIIVTFLCAVMVMAFMPAMAFAAEPCAHENMRLEVYKQATVGKSGEAYKQCADCGKYASKKTTAVNWYTGKTNATKFKYYEEYTLNYAHTIGGSTVEILGKYRAHSISNDFYFDYGSKTLPFGTEPSSVPKQPGYKPLIWTGGDQYYEVLFNGKTYPYFKTNNSVEVASWAKDLSNPVGDTTEFTVLPVYKIDVPDVSILQDGFELTARVDNINENLDYTYEWSKDGNVMADETGASISITAADGGAEYSVTVTAQNAEDSVILVGNAAAASATATLMTVAVFEVSLNANGGADIETMKDIASGESITLPEAALGGFTQEGWYNADTDTFVGKAGETVMVSENISLLMKRAIEAPTVYVAIDDNDGAANAKPRTLTANVTEDEGLSYSYQWYKDGAAIQNGNSKSLTIGGNAADSGVYKVVVTAVKADGSAVVTINEKAAAEAGFTLKLTEPEKPETEIPETENPVTENPKTSDASNMIMWMAAMMLSATGAFALKRRE